MKAIVICFGVIGLCLSSWLVYLLFGGTAFETFSAQGSQLMAMEWGRISLLDLYAGFFFSLVFVWIIEPKLWLKIMLTLTLPTLGNPILAVWILFRLKHLITLTDKRNA